MKKEEVQKKFHSTEINIKRQSQSSISIKDRENYDKNRNTNGRGKTQRKRRSSQKRIRQMTIKFSISIELLAYVGVEAYELVELGQQVEVQPWKYYILSIVIHLW